MSLPKPLKIFCCVFLSLQLSHIPAVAAAEHMMVPTVTVLTELERAQAEQRVENFVNQAEVQKLLAAQGLSSQEISSRLASLSPWELQQLVGQVDQARAGGDILVTILLIVLIIYLVKRI